MLSTRRSFLRRFLVVSSAFTGLRRFLEQPACGAVVREAYYSSRAKFVRDPNRVMDLPRGFSYHRISNTGELMDDGLLVPGKHDGMCAFPTENGRTLLVRNHELEPTQTELSPFGRNPRAFSRTNRSLLYDAGRGRRPGLGGTTTLVYDTRRRRLERHFLSLAGTYRNCAGGQTPWRTWITCEESVVLAGGDAEKDHGYNFEVPAEPEIRLHRATPLKAMGRFYHEAVAVDPQTGIVYQTEDRPDGLFYRFLPSQPGRLIAGGKLQALKVRDATALDTRNWLQSKIAPGQSLPVEWVDLADVQSPDDDLRYQGFFARGAARFARGEGIWYGGEAVFFACTNGGRKKKGQIWRYAPSPHEGTAAENDQPGRLELYIEPNDARVVENADNLTMAPWGDLVLCEDGVSPQHLVGLSPAGRFYYFGRTTLSELAGVTFSPDGTTLFANIQTPGLTLAITGPWADLRK